MINEPDLEASAGSLHLEHLAVVDDEEQDFSTVSKLLVNGVTVISE